MRFLVVAMDTTFRRFQNRLQFSVGDRDSVFVFAHKWVTGKLMKPMAARHVVRVLVDAHVVAIRKRVG